MNNVECPQIAILTPTYNRAYILPELYKSLLRQTSCSFTWYIVDDGSTDDTKDVCAQFNNSKFEIKYIKKENGGKHTALNEGVAQIQEELTFIVDSDDYLTDDAVETIIKDWVIYRDQKDIVGLSYYRIDKNGQVIGDKYPQERFVDTYANVRINGNVSGDKAELYRTEALKSHPFPVFEGEKFCSEAIVWNAISKDNYNLVFISKGIYVCEYRADGLTSAGRKKMFENPLGYLEHAKSYLYSGIKQKIQWKYILMYIAVSRLKKGVVKNAYRNCPRKIKFLLAYPFGVVLSICWKRQLKAN